MLGRIFRAMDLLPGGNLTSVWWPLSLMQGRDNPFEPMGVCRRWKEAALQESWLWSAVEIDIAELYHSDTSLESIQNRLDIYFGRSALTTLSLLITLPDDVSPLEFKGVLTSMFTHIRRWRKAEFTANQATIATIMKVLPHAVRLRNLRLSRSGDIDQSNEAFLWQFEEYRLNNSYLLPSLETLTLLMADPSTLPRLACPKLQTLQFSYCNVDTPDWRQFSVDFPLLSSLVFDSRVTHIDEDDKDILCDPHTGILFPNLRSVQLHDSLAPDEWMALANICHAAPGLERLHLNIPTPNTDLFLSYSLENLTELGLCLSRTVMLTAEETALYERFDNNRLMALLERASRLSAITLIWDTLFESIEVSFSPFLRVLSMEEAGGNLRFATELNKLDLQTVYVELPDLLTFAQKRSKSDIAKPACTITLKNCFALPDLAAVKCCDLAAELNVPRPITVPFVPGKY